MTRLDRATIYLALTMLLGGTYGFIGMLSDLPAADWSGAMIAVALGASPVITAFLLGGAMLETSLQAVPVAALFVVHVYFLIRLPPGGSRLEREEVRLAELVAGPVPALMEELHRAFREPDDDIAVSPRRR